MAGVCKTLNKNKHFEKKDHKKIIIRKRSSQNKQTNNEDNHE